MPGYGSNDLATPKLCSRWNPMPEDRPSEIFLDEDRDEGFDFRQVLHSDAHRPTSYCGFREHATEIWPAY